MLVGGENVLVVSWGTGPTVRARLLKWSFWSALKVAVNSLGESLFRPVFARLIFATCARMGDGGAKETAAGARQSANSVTFSRVWRRGGRGSAVRRGGWRAIADARQPFLGRTKSSEPRSYGIGDAVAQNPPTCSQMQCDFLYRQLRWGDKRETAVPPREEVFKARNCAVPRQRPKSCKCGRKEIAK